MISESLPNKREPINKSWQVTTHPVGNTSMYPYKNQQASILTDKVSGIQDIKNLFNVAQQRNKIVQDLAATCLYQVGDSVLPRDANVAMEMGELQVGHIAFSYADMGKGEKWPSDNVPAIVWAFGKGTGKNQSAFFKPDELIKFTDND